MKTERSKVKSLKIEKSKNLSIFGCFNLSIFLMLLFTFHFSLFTFLDAATVDKISTTITDHELQVLVSTDASQYKHFSLNNPPRIIIDFYDAKYNLPSRKIRVDKQGLETIRSSLFKQGIVRIVLDLQTKLSYKIEKHKTGVVVLLPKTEYREPRTEITEPRKPIFYRSRGKHDPFKPYIGEKEVSDSLLDAHNAILVGIMWSPKNRFALFQSQQGKTFILEEGDKVIGGRLANIKKQSVVFSLKEFGRTHSVELRILPKKK